MHNLLKILEFSMVKNKVKANNSFNLTKVDEIPAQIVHLCNCHLIPLLIDIDNTWSEVGIDFKSSFTTNHIIFFVVELIL